MKILVFVPPFAGHYRVLQKMQQEYPDYEYQFICSSWQGMKVDGMIHVGSTEPTGPNPWLFTFPRVEANFSECLALAEQFSPDLIVYDFFSLEGFFVGQRMGVPTWSSIPVVVAPNVHLELKQEVLDCPINQTAIASLQSQVNFNFDDLEILSDGVFYPGDKNLVWSFSDLILPNFNFGRNKTSDYHFVGNLNPYRHRSKDQIYISFGTVLMGNLWHRRSDFREGLTQLIDDLASAIQDTPVCLATRGKEVLKSYPSNWQIKDPVDQIEELARSKVFITHGGTNSYHESVLQKSPMIVLPFFADTRIVGATVENKGLGINLDNHFNPKELNIKNIENISVKQDFSLLFENDPQNVSQKVLKSLEIVLENQTIYADRFDQLKLHKEDLEDLFNSL